MRTALALAILSSLCFGIALVTGRIGLRTLDARSGAAVSIPTATVLFALAAPFAFDGAGFTILAALISASLLGYSVSSAIVVGANQVGRSKRPQLTKHGAAWFALTGVLNGGAVLLMYGALSIAPVSLVAPIVATYPLVTVSVSAAVLREEPITLRMVAGAAITVLAMVYLVASRTGA